MKTKRWQSFLWFAGLMVLANGCATHALWEEGRFARFYDPARPANLRAFHSQQKDDVLVVYDELRDDNDSLRRRAYWLRENNEPARNPHKPGFVSKREARGLQELAVFETGATNVAANLPLYIVVAPNHQDFALYSSERKLGDYELPVYPDSTGRVLQVFLTPVAVVADITIIGSVVFVYALASGPNCYSFSP